MTEPPAYLALANGTVLEGRCRSPGTAHGEVVFTTAYTGYEESLTDPSYAKQVITFAYPLIGNYGVREERFESDTVQPTAAIAREFTEDVGDWLADTDTPAIDCLDTRDLVLAIREEGAMQCGIAAGEDATPKAARSMLDACRPMGAYSNIGAAVSTDTVQEHNPTGSPTIALIDCGCKDSIIDSFTDRDAAVYQYPADAPVRDVLASNPDLLFISNGPGDPETFTNAQQLVDHFAGDVPVAGICLGQQIVALALGGSTEKMRFGHRGVNQPVMDRASGRVVMTTQNHGYTVSDPGPLEVTQHNINDDSAEGLRSEELSVLTRQYHPEANPGPNDTRAEFFDTVISHATGTDRPAETTAADD